ncbi:Mov34/MPN/PAD-1 family protein [Heliobacterium mobile]|nr:Mov34/MPN/PAD-1 family protein [Heliobacterium mobile]
MSEEIRVDSVKVEILEKAFGETTEALKRSGSEAGGLLLGNVFFQEKNGRLGALVRVEAFLPAHHAEPVHTSLKLTEATWETWEQMRKQFPKLQVVGWVHSHQGCGIFFSGQDLTNQESFFPKPWHIAWVMDTHTDKQGIFRWKQGTMVATEDWQVLRVVRTARSQSVTASIRSSQPLQNPAPASGSPSIKWEASNQIKKQPPVVTIIDEGLEETVRLPNPQPALSTPQKVNLSEDNAQKGTPRPQKDPMKEPPIQARQIRQTSYREERPWKRMLVTLGLGLLVFIGAALVTVGVYTFFMNK